MDQLARGAHSSEEGEGRIRVSTETAATGAQSLKFTDAPGLQLSYNPHLYYTPNLRHGTARAEFSIRLAPGAAFYHEWRDNQNPYQTGPSLWFREGKLLVGGNALLDIAPDTWVRIAIDCPLGAAANGTYNLSVTLPDGAVHAFDGLENGAAGFRKLDWLGFVSNAQESVAVYLDDVAVATVR